MAQGKKGRPVSFRAVEGVCVGGLNLCKLEILRNFAEIGFKRVVLVVFVLIQILIKSISVLISVFIEIVAKTLMLEIWIKLLNFFYREPC